MIGVDPDDGRTLDWCQKPDCERAVAIGNTYCCGSCGLAAEPPPYEIHEHTGGCDERWARRRPHIKMARYPTPPEENTR